MRPPAVQRLKPTGVPTAFASRDLCAADSADDPSLLKQERARRKKPEIIQR